MKKTNFLLKWKNARFVGMRKSRCSSSHVGTSIPARNVPLKFINVHCVESILRNLYLHFFHNIEMVVCAMMRECKVSNAKAQSFTFNFEINLTLWVIFYIIYIYMYYVFFLQSIFYITFFFIWYFYPIFEVPYPWQQSKFILVPDMTFYCYRLLFNIC